jgi:hypothetical protein
MPSYLADYVCNISTHHAEAMSSGILYPIAYFHSFDHLSPSQVFFYVCHSKC